MDRIKAVLRTNPVCFWTFSRENTSIARQPYTLTDVGGNIATVSDGIFAEFCADMGKGKYFMLARADCPALDFSGENSSLTIVAWVKRRMKMSQECQAVAGMWNETDRQRQYCLFLDLRIWESHDQVCGHVSAIGGATAGFRYCMDASIGRNPVPYGEWHCIAFSYDGKYARSYIDGVLDARDSRNPYDYDKPLFSPAVGGADFTVGAVNRSGEMGNWYEGLLGGLAVYDRALTEQELAFMP